MVTRIPRIIALPALAAVLSAVVACTAPDPAPSPTPEPSPVREAGYALTCFGVRGDGSRVIVDLYTNSTVKVPTSVSVFEAGEDGNPLLGASDTAPSPTITEQEVSADVPMVDMATRADAGTAEVRGTYRPTGDVRQINEDFVDAGERIRTTGTNENLTTDLRVQIGPERITLECRDAFRFDLQVTKTPLPG